MVRQCFKVEYYIIFNKADRQSTGYFEAASLVELRSKPPVGFENLRRRSGGKGEGGGSKL